MLFSRRSLVIVIAAFCFCCWCGYAATPELAPRCAFYCNAGDSAYTSSLCANIVPTGQYCTGNFFRVPGAGGASGMFVLHRIRVVPRVIPTSMAFGGWCYAGATTLRVPVPNTTSTVCPPGSYEANSDCYVNPPIDACLNYVGGASNGNGCQRSFPMAVCATGYSFNGSVCVKTYKPNAVDQARCQNNTNETVGCQWCAATSICVPNTTTCPTSCANAPADLCTLPPSTCKWCSNNSSIGVCQSKTGTCWPSCLAASNDTVASWICSNSSSCRWCGMLGYCSNTDTLCIDLCAAIAPIDPATCKVASIQAKCRWCDGIQYCVDRGEAAELQCASSCSQLSWQGNLCVGALTCHWCGPQHGRCKPLKSTGYVSWRREVECDTSSYSASWTELPKSSSLSSGGSQSITASRTTLTTKTQSMCPSRSFTETASASGIVTSSLSLSKRTMSVSRHSMLPTASLTQTNSTTPTNTNSLVISISATRSTSISSTMSSSQSPSSSVQTPSRSGTTESHSHSQRTPSTSATFYCAMLRADGETSAGNLHPFNWSNVPDRVIALSPEIVALRTSSAVATPVSREDILQSLPLGSNLSLSLSGTIRGGQVDAWGLVRVKMDVTTVGSSFPLFTDIVRATIMSTTVIGRKQLLTLLLHPPNATTPPRWLPMSLSRFRSVTLVLQLSLLCPTSDSITSDVIVELPCPGEDQPLASEVKAAGTVAQYSSLVSLPAAGAAVGRLAAMRSLALCSASTAVKGVLTLTVDNCGDANDTAASDAWGNVLGNLVLWGAGLVFMAVVIAAYAHVGDTSLRVAAEALGAPSQLLPLVVVTIPSTASSTFYLLSVSASCSANGFLAAVGVAMCVVPIVVLSAVSYAVPRRLTLVMRQQPKARFPSYGVQSCVALCSPLFFQRVKWHENDAPLGNVQGQLSATEMQDPLPLATTMNATNMMHSNAHTWRRATAVLLMDYAVVWFACIDVAVLTVSCVLGALGMLEDQGVCQAGAVVILVLYLMQLALCAVLRPFTTLFSHVYALFSLALSVFAMTCGVWFLYGTANDLVDSDAQIDLLTVAAICDLLPPASAHLRL
ncbi:GPI-anchored surface protein, putative [Bodo saltans]|uniref:GPI-anchored surface protein, putative n=1 Tax=Bodo saltans TaxID=75058 RepID=A0A0S4KLC1_BODSA|nr:GPI-anchored surface protein, putative [Bodo saltans]|eukprot:CUI14300.1 GPI-anchored surface protein, putative [Bodo saltans]